MCQAEAIKKANISVRGIVQGVGFRPFVYQLAAKHGLSGWVCNTTGEVRIEVEGQTESLRRFFDQLTTHTPPLAHIDAIQCHFLPPEGYRIFEIRESQPEQGTYQRISPDVATCSQCLDEVFDAKDRRYRYPFTNCTNCGPRFTIIRDIPYDRPATTMQPFTMCAECRSEYHNPLDRRFHAQPNCCPACGPHLQLGDKNGNSIASSDPLRDVAALLKQGKVVALKGLGGFLLACDATNEAAVQLLRQRKRRAFKPFAVMMAALAAVKKHCVVSPEEENLLASVQSPIVLLRLKKKHAIALAVAPQLNYLGVLLPYTPLHHQLLREADLPLVMTSGNLSEEPIVKDNAEALEKLSNIADYFLFHNRDIHTQCDDSVTMVENNEPRVIRRARGYAPDPILLPFRAKEVLACGAELKNTFCCTKDAYAFMSPHIGDLDNLETLNHFEKVLDHYRRLFRLDPRIVACDKHPDYLSTRYAWELGEKDAALTVIPVQHHHAHIVSCLVENGAEPPILGVAFDGTGYGDDGCIWGGEFLLVNYQRSQRLGHLEYIPLPGGDAAIKKPYRTAISYLVTLLGNECLQQPHPFLRDIGALEIELIRRQVEKGINAPLTSSAGRLFDGVSALLGVRNEVDYEGQAAMELEMIAREESGQKIYPFGISEEDGQKHVQLGDLVAQIVRDRNRGIHKAEIASRFHHTLAQLISRMCLLLARETGIRQVALSGGVFQNRLLTQLARQSLETAGFRVFTHRQVPCNDGGISLGQAVIAHFLAQE